MRLLPRFRRTKTQTSIVVPIVSRSMRGDIAHRPSGVANNPDTPLLSVGDVGVLLETGPEVLAGSTRLAAGTAQKAALNALSTAVLVRLGGAYDNLMVGMRPLNAKLKQRAVEIDPTSLRIDDERGVEQQQAHRRSSISTRARSSARSFGRDHIGQ